MCILLDWSSLWFKVNGKTRYSKSGDCEIFIILPHPDHIKLSDRDNIFWQIVGKYWQTCVSLAWRFYMLESLFALPSFNILSNKKFYFHLQTWISQHLWQWQQTRAPFLLALQERSQKTPKNALCPICVKWIHQLGLRSLFQWLTIRGKKAKRGWLNLEIFFEQQKVGHSCY